MRPGCNQRNPTLTRAKRDVPCFYNPSPLAGYRCLFWQRNGSPKRVTQAIRTALKRSTSPSRVTTAPAVYRLRSFLVMRMSCLRSALLIGYTALHFTGLDKRGVHAHAYSRELEKLEAKIGDRKATRVGSKQPDGIPTYLQSHLAMLSVIRNIIPLPSANASLNSVVKPRKIIIWRSCGRCNNGTTAIEPHWSVSNNVCCSVGLGIETWGARPGCLFLLLMIRAACQCSIEVRPVAKAGLTRETAVLLIRIRAKDGHSFGRRIRRAHLRWVGGFGSPNRHDTWPHRGG
ncbi:hypothetical protein F4803DRAFT_34340 [Xylaria telfairii]|nr:hypothetical protein F4803DRAFT_34340 [Xylaria telfairii]